MCGQIFLNKYHKEANKTWQTIMPIPDYDNDRHNSDKRDPFCIVFNYIYFFYVSVSYPITANIRKSK